MRVHEGLLQNTNIDTCHHDHNSRVSVNGWHTNNTTCGALQKEYRRQLSGRCTTVDGAHTCTLCSKCNMLDTTSHFALGRLPSTNSLARAAHSFAKVSTWTIEHGTKVRVDSVVPPRASCQLRTCQTRSRDGAASVADTLLSTVAFWRQLAWSPASSEATTCRGFGTGTLWQNLSTVHGATCSSWLSTKPHRGMACCTDSTTCHCSCNLKSSIDSPPSLPTTCART